MQIDLSPLALTFAQKLDIDPDILRIIKSKTGSDFKLVDPELKNNFKLNVFVETVLSQDCVIEHLQKVALNYPELRDSIDIQIKALRSSTYIDVTKLRPIPGSNEEFFEVQPNIVKAIMSTQPISKRLRKKLCFQFSVPNPNANALIVQLNSELSNFGCFAIETSPKIRTLYFFNHEEAKEKGSQLESQGEIVRISRIDGASSVVSLSNAGGFQNGIPPLAEVRKLSQTEWSIKCADVYRVDSVLCNAILKKNSY